MKTEFEIAKHALVPKHFLLNKEEADEALKKFNVTLAQMPRISKKDPVIAEIKATAGDLIKIIRKSPTAEETIFYRVVTDD